MKSNKITLNIKGMSCSNCARSIENKLRKTAGISNVSVNFSSGKAYIDIDSNVLHIEDLIKTIQGLGFEAIPQYEKVNAEIILLIGGMNCSSCSNRIEKRLISLNGIENASVNIATGTARVIYDPSAIRSINIRDEIISLGFEVIDTKGQTKKIREMEREKLNKAYKNMIFGISFALPIMVLMAIDMLIIKIPYYFYLMLLLGFSPVMLAGRETHKNTYKALKNKAPNMDTLVTMGSLIPYLLSFLGLLWELTSFVEMAASIMTFHLIGRYLEAKAKGRASRAIQRLLELEADNAVILLNGEEISISIEELRPGDIMIVRPGEKVPADGLIVDGTGSLDESMATGESMPVERGPGNEVIGSTINRNGLFKVKVTKVGKDTFLAKVIKLVEEAQGSKVPIQEFADRVTGYFVPFVILLSISAFVLWLIFPEFFRGILMYFDLPWSSAGLPPESSAILAMIAVLVISCPCALGLATPTAIMVGSGKGAQEGVLIRNGEAIQTLKEIKMIAFDKTGTITKGLPEITDIIPITQDKTKILKLAASLEYGSKHPLADSIIKEAEKNNIPLNEVKDFKSISGRGIKGIIDGEEVMIGSRGFLKDSGISISDHENRINGLEKEGKTTMLLVSNKQLAGIFAVSDTIKTESARAIKEIEKMGIKTAMITGDNHKTADVIAKQLGISEVHSEVMPDGKVDKIKELQKEYGKVAMVGDGINDAPALKQANVGIALGTGTDIAIEAADITLISGELGAVISAIKLSRAIFRKIRQNYFWAWIYNLIAIPAAFFGLIHPVIGAAAMFTSSINVVLNSARLRSINIKPAF